MESEQIVNRDQEKTTSLLVILKSFCGRILTDIHYLAIERIALT